MPAESPVTPKSLTNMRVLVVDDDADILFFAKHFLESAGCVVMDFLEPEQAVTVLKSQSVDLLLTDFKMPGNLNGLDLAQLATRLHPTIKVIIATGMDPDFCKQISEAGFLVLDKPYNHDQLVQTIQSLFAE